MFLQLVIVVKSVTMIQDVLQLVIVVKSVTMIQDVSLQLVIVVKSVTMIQDVFAACDSSSVCHYDPRCFIAACDSG